MNQQAHSTTPQDAERRAVVFSKGSEVFADSRDVAVSFNKRHTDVLRAVRELIAKQPDLGRRNFASFVLNDLTGETTSHFEMDRRGFTLLAMGFTGEKALKWKLLYIDAFEMMESELRRGILPAPDYSDPAVILGCLQALQGQVAQKDAIIADLSPKAEALDLIAESHGSFTRTVAAKMLNVPPMTLIRWLRTHQWTYRSHGGPDDLAYQAKIASGDLEHKIMTGIKEDGSQWSSTQVRITPKGMTVLAKAFPPAVREVKS